MSRGLRRFDRIAPARSAPRRATIFWALGQGGRPWAARGVSRHHGVELYQRPYPGGLWRTAPAL